MFSQRKSILRKRWFVFVIIGLLGIGYWVNQSPDSLVNPDNLNKVTEINKPVETDYEQGDQNNPVQSAVNELDSTNTENETPFYLIREVDKVICIYYYGENGEETFVKNTDIAFQLLSEADQALFSQGIIKNTEEELEELLQDFGS